MNEKQALTILDQATSALTVNRNTHMEIINALQTISKFIEANSPKTNVINSVEYADKQ
jgi:hypothetical protein